MGASEGPTAVAAPATAGGTGPAPAATGAKSTAEVEAAAGADERVAQPSGPAGNGTAQRQPVRGGLLRRVFSRLAADPEELEAEELQAAIPGSGATPISACQDREQVCVVGTLRTVTFRPRAGVPALEAELWDGTGSVSVIFLGRREIPGIDPGRTIKLRGRITVLKGHRAIYNPVYELRPTASEAAEH